MQNFYYDLPDDIITIINKEKSAFIIQCYAIKMFYKKYGIEWKNFLNNYQQYLDFFCYITGINDPIDDYVNYYRN